MYRIISFLLVFAVLGFSLTACDENLNSPEAINSKPSVTQQKTASDANPALPSPVLAKDRLSKTTHTASAASQNANSASQSVVNERYYEIRIAENIYVPCCDWGDASGGFYIWGYGHLVVTPSGQIHININGSDFYAADPSSNGGFTRGTGTYISNLGSDGSSGRDKSVAKIKMTAPNGCVWYFSLYLRFVDGEPEIYVADVTCEE